MYQNVQPTIIILMLQIMYLMFWFTLSGTGVSCRFVAALCVESTRGPMHRFPIIPRSLLSRCYGTTLTTTSTDVCLCYETNVTNIDKTLSYGTMI